MYVNKKEKEKKRELHFVSSFGNLTVWDFWLFWSSLCVWKYFQTSAKQRRFESAEEKCSVLPPCKDTTMSSEAPGSQVALLGFTLYFSGAVVRTCGETQPRQLWKRKTDTAMDCMEEKVCLHQWCTQLGPNTQTHSNKTPTLQHILLTNLEGHLILGDVGQDNEAFLFSVFGAEAEFLCWAEGGVGVGEVEERKSIYLWESVMKDIAEFNQK